MGMCMWVCVCLCVVDGWTSDVCACYRTSITFASCVGNVWLHVHAKFEKTGELNIMIEDFYNRRTPTYNNIAAQCAVCTLHIIEHTIRCWRPLRTWSANRSAVYKMLIEIRLMTTPREFLHSCRRRCHAICVNANAFDSSDIPQTAANLIRVCICWTVRQKQQW